jgi:DNA-binding MarR family transcriptional regulator
MSELACVANTSQASLTGVVDRLEALGLVERIRSSEDRRVVEVAITATGREEKRRVQAEIAERLSAMLEPLTAEESRELLRLFRKLNGRSPEGL